jgi:hypothetical protein
MEMGHGQTWFLLIYHKGCDIISGETSKLRTPTKTYLTPRIQIAALHAIAALYKFVLICDLNECN